MLRKQYGLDGQMEPNGTEAEIWVALPPASAPAWRERIRAYLAGLTFERNTEWYGER